MKNKNVLKNTWEKKNVIKSYMKKNDMSLSSIVTRKKNVFEKLHGAIKVINSNFTRKLHAIS